MEGRKRPSFKEDDMNNSSLTTENNEKMTILYARLSQDDGNKGDSNSIVNQRQMLEDFAKKQNFRNLAFLSDDGISGTTFERPAFKQAIDLVQSGKVANFVVKDLSRFGRDYLKVGMFTEVMFPEKNVRFIAINDNVDSTREEDNSLAPFRNMFNEWYARDCSKKIKAVKHMKGNAGQPLTCIPPYGYVRDPADKNHWLVDDEAAEIVRRIFKEYKSGLSLTQIAKGLGADKILIPARHKLKIGAKTSIAGAHKYQWSSDTISTILDNLVFCGHTVNFKTYKKSYKTKKCLPNARENWKIFKNTHEAIIDEKDFEQVQAMRKATKRRYTKSGKVGLFAGVAFCADCGRREIFMGSKDYYYCGGIKSHQVKCSSAHGIYEKNLTRLALENFREIANLVREDEGKLVQLLRDKFELETAQTFAKEQRELKQAENRMAELDTIFTRLYEDNVSGKISDDRFAKMSAGYESEQAELSKKVQEFREKSQRQGASEKYVVDFVKLVKKYTEPGTLTHEMVREIFAKIHVGEAVREDGKRTQKIVFEYQLVGAIDYVQ